MARKKGSGCGMVLVTGVFGGLTLVFFAAGIWAVIQKAGEEREVREAAKRVIVADAQREVEAAQTPQGGGTETTGTGEVEEIFVSARATEQMPVRPGTEETLRKVLEQRSAELVDGSFLELQEVAGVKKGDSAETLKARFGVAQTGRSDWWVIGDLFPGMHVYGYCDGKVVFLAGADGRIETTLLSSSPLVGASITRQAIAARATPDIKDPTRVWQGKGESGTVITIADAGEMIGAQFVGQIAEKAGRAVTVLAMQVDNSGSNETYKHFPTGNVALTSRNVTHTSFAVERGWLPDKIDRMLGPGDVLPGQQGVFLIVFADYLDPNYLLAVQVNGRISAAPVYAKR